MSTIHESSNASDPATSCSSTLPSVDDQATSSCTLSSISDQATSSLTSPIINEQAANCLGQTSGISSVLHVESDQTKEYLQMVSADDCCGYKHADYLRVIDNDADYLHIVDDNHSTVSQTTKRAAVDLIILNVAVNLTASGNKTTIRLLKMMMLTKRLLVHNQITCKM